MTDETTDPMDEFVDDETEEGGLEAYGFEVWNDYDPSMRWKVVFPLSEEQGTEAGTIAYYEFEPGRHSGLHADNAEELVYVLEGEGEAFVSGVQVPLETGRFTFFKRGVQHDLYAYGATPLRLMSFFPTNVVESTFNMTVFPMGGNLITSKVPARNEAPVITEINPDDMPDEILRFFSEGEAVILNPENAADADE